MRDARTRSGEGEDARDWARRGEWNSRRSGLGRVTGEDEAKPPILGYLETRRPIVHRETAHRPPRTVDNRACTSIFVLLNRPVVNPENAPIPGTGTYLVRHASLTNRTSELARRTRRATTTAARITSTIRSGSVRAGCFTGSSASGPSDRGVVTSQRVLVRFGSTREAVFGWRSRAALALGTIESSFGFVVPCPCQSWTSRSPGASADRPRSGVAKT